MYKNKYEDYYSKYMFGHGGTDKQIDSEKISILLYVVGSLLEVVGPPAI